LSTKKESRFVLAEDCIKQHERLELALFGKDGREGMVKDVSDIKTFIKDQAKHNEEDKQDKKEKRESSLRWKIAAIGFACSLAGFVGQYLLSRLSG